MNTKSNIVVALAIITVGLVSFISGRFSVDAKAEGRELGGEEVVKEIGNEAGNSTKVDSETANPSTVAADAGENLFVASKNGQKYFPISCGSAKTIKKENAIYFKTMEEAELSGRTQSVQCKY